MRILGILGSPHKSGNTNLLMEATLAGAAAAGADTEQVNLGELEMKFCVACAKCYADGTCIHEDDVAALTAKMSTAEGLVLGSPNYMHTVTAQMKTLMDRCSVHVHCFLLEGKYGAAVATAGGSGEEQVAEYENEFLQLCGARTVGIAAAKAAGPKALLDQEAALARADALGRNLVAAIREKREYPDQAAAHAAFFPRMKELVTRRGDRCPFQFGHWQSKGWL
ncbi:MAG: iron-sulfur protein [Armatimonadetes bacterium CG_4_10_14_3_um_filter_66_18]|nr:flavodoxin family protein [Armatimonadota bacterium]PIU93087.1 MAG: iron-sulfur protein [Armatimonadetes bacterium CG06_land_8_20_14_3_00_66_21]PIX37207.1 MAG: iron-sulfur protein [Armatimonadetes bacterium CG_4_8_14_3_um_filter_66_20]PIY47468.1 MAG: iron-sulfur protein [Armatimonadetes bacterium CG_4_10_14_3_um_filter_66_18]PJB71804.1 MAG: iron-sulfur protein [Armatimonadetes bacterium CG_4_9_14_3_um_filter_66_14]